MARKTDYSTWTKEELINLIHLLEKKKKYGLVWDQDSTVEIFEQSAVGSLPILEEVPNYRINNNSHNCPHIIIEGDNYHALSVLNYTHENMIDLIYIDPPYNTGERDFRYNDHWVDKEDAYRHSKWLSFMSKRLVLARRLLKISGVIFISIDDNEVSQLRLLCDSVFGEDNFIAQFIHKNNSSKNQANLVSISTEYLIAYARDLKTLKNNRVRWRTEKRGVKDIDRKYRDMKNQGYSLDEILEEIKEIYRRPKYSHLSRWNKVDEHGIFVDADLSREGGPKDYTIINPETGLPCIIPDRGWGKSYEELLSLQQDGLIWYGDPSTPPRVKNYITSEDTSVPDNFLYFDNSVDTRLIKEMFGSLVFENPKPLEMIKFIIKMATHKDAIILDFFAGSGTTGHAVLLLNKEDSGNRQFILCTNNENQIATEVCYPRIKNIIMGYTDTKGRTINGTNGKVLYYRTNFVPEEMTDRNKELFTRRSTEMLCLRENTFDLVKETEHWKIYSNDHQYTIILFDQLYIPEIKQEISNLENSISIYIFSLEDDDFSEYFSDIQERVTYCSIPEAILRIYRRIYK